MPTSFQRVLIPASVTVVVALLNACGGGSGDDGAETVPDVTVAPTVDSAAAGETGASSTADPPANPFTAVVECLRGQGLAVQEPSFAGGEGFPQGGPPAGGSMPDGPPGGGSFPGDGQFPGGSLPPGVSFPDGSAPPRGQAEPGVARAQNPAFLAQMLGLDGSDPNVAAAIETCTADV